MTVTKNIVATHQTCPECKHNECYTEFASGGGFCHSCGFKKKGEDNESHTPDFVGESSLTSEYRGFRGVKPDVAEFLNITTLVKEDGTEYARVYPYPHRPKMRVLPKDFSKNKGFTNDMLLGMDMFNASSSKCLTIVEGEDDWAAVYQMLRGRWPVVALPGAQTVNHILKTHYKYLDSFDTIAIATDSDEPGEQAAKRLADAFPNKCYRVTMTKHKDPMEYLESGNDKEFLYAWTNRSKYVAEWDTNTTEQFISLFRESSEKRFVATGIEEYDRIGMGLFQGELTVFTAPEGIGKTEFMRYLQYNLIANHDDVSFAYCHLEETPQRSLLGLASYHLQKNVTRKDLIENMEEVEEAITEMMGSERVHQFRIGTDEDPQVLIERIKYYANVCGCQYVFFEPIQDLVHQRTEGKTSVEFLDGLAVQLARTAAESGVGIITIAHMNDDGNIRDSRLIGKQAAVRVDLTRNLIATDSRDRNTTTLTFRKNRPVGPVGYGGQMEFDLHTFTMQERID